MVCNAWLLVVGGQEQDSRLCVRDEGSCYGRRSGAGQQAMRPGLGKLLWSAVRCRAAGYVSGMREAAMVGGQVQGSRLCVRDKGSCFGRRSGAG